MGKLSVVVEIPSLEIFNMRLNRHVFEVIYEQVDPVSMKGTGRNVLKVSLNPNILLQYDPSIHWCLRVFCDQPPRCFSSCSFSSKNPFA